MKFDLINALVTPFDDDNKIDFEVLKKLINDTKDYHDGYLISGSTGEGDSLSIMEIKQLIEFLSVFSFKKIVCIPEDCTYKIIEMIKKLQIPKDFFILVRVPSYYLPNEKGIIEHFKMILNSFPEYRFMIYDIKKRTGTTISIDGYKAISSCCPNLFGVKECNNDFKKVKELSKFLNVFSGNDENYREYLKNGAVGHISVCSIFMKEYFLGYKSFFNFEYSKDPNPIGIKMMLKKLGYKSMNVRLPLFFD